MSMQIRRAKSTDIPSITKLKGIKDEKRYLKRIHETDNNKGAYLIADLDDQIVGQVFLKYYGTEIFPSFPNMEDLLVSQTSRCKGIGTALIHECERLSKERNYSKIGLSVNPISNKQAKSLYEKLGYLHNGDYPHLDGVYNGVEDWVIDLVKTL